ncbi:MAG TPA: hypothetical protein VFZ65_17095 [Planctomycetota bacterium]|nr:hypothetical protein [Planctomycetota bacterium]
MFHVTRTVFLVAGLGTLLAAGLCPGVAAQSTPAKAPTASDEQAPKKPIVAGLAHLELSVSKGRLHAAIHGALPGFFGVVLLSASPAQTEIAAGLPLLTDFVVLGGGHTDTQDLELWSQGPLADWPLELYGQALAFDGNGIWVSGIVPIALPAPNEPVLAQPARLW